MMNRHSHAPRAAFQPPSDMGGGGGGSSTGKKVFIGLGLGCGVVLLIVGILFAAGAFKALTCCNDLQQIIGDVTVATDFSTQFATDVHEGRFDVAYNRTTAEYQSSTDLATFEAMFAPHREMLAAEPRQAGMRPVDAQAIDGQSLDAIKSASWDFDFHFTNNTPTMVVLTVRVVKQDDALAIDAVSVDQRQRELAFEAPAMAVRSAFDDLKRGSYEMVHMKLDEEMRTSTDVEAWKTFLNAEGAVLTSGQMEVRDVSYADGGRATVMTHNTAADGRNAIVQWELREQMNVWRIIAIAPLVGQAQPPKPVDGDAPVEEGAAGEIEVEVEAVNVE